MTQLTLLDNAARGRVCTKCRAYKPLSEFHRQSQRKSGYKAQCKKCSCAATRKNYHKKREHYLNYAKRYMKERRNRDRANVNRKKVHLRDPRKQMLQHARRRARLFGLPFDLVLDDLVIPQRCPALGIPLFPGGGRRQHDCSPTVDRIKPELGYVRGNIAVISWRANRFKSDATLQELEGVFNYCKSALGVSASAPSKEA